MTPHPLVEVPRPHSSGPPLTVHRLDPSCGVPCFAEAAWARPTLQRCTRTASYVTRSGFPVCGHHIEPASITRLWP